MTATYDCIATTTLGSDQASVTFSSISGSFTDLVLVINYGFNTSDDYLSLQLNSDSTMSNYSMTNVRGDGTSAASNRYSSTTGRYNVTALPGANGSIGSIAVINFMNYSNSTTNKTWLVRDNAASTGTQAAVGLWRNTNAITSIRIGEADGGNLRSGSTFALYGIKAE